jgi:transglutaminase-like putative cysteine protease
MRPDRRSGVLEYATLGVASVCLLVAEAPFFVTRGFSVAPSVLIAPVLVLLAIAWWGNGRWVLPVWGANVVALLILAGTAVWVYSLSSDNDSWFYYVPMPAGLVPLMGPLLPALMLVRLFRPRGPADFWLLQGMGVVQVALACVLATGPELGGLLAAYLVCGLGCLAEHYLLAGRFAAGAPEGAQANPGRSPGRFIYFLLRWTAVVGVSALGLFLVTPRSQVNDWEPLREYGGLRVSRPSLPGSIQGVDLNHTGWVLTGNDIAFSFQATAGSPDGPPVTDLSPELRWRGTILEAYQHGRWLQRVRPRSVSALGDSPDLVGLPDLGPGQLFLTITVRPREAGGLFLADPIRLGTSPSRRIPELTLQPAGLLGLFIERAGTVLHGGYRPRTEYRYVQVLPPRRPPNDPSALRNPTGVLEGGYLAYLLPDHPLPPLVPWTTGLLRRLASDPVLLRRVASGPRYDLAGVLPQLTGDLDHELSLEGDTWEPVARALCDYLAHSGEYTYTLQLQREQPDLDPVLDFLFYTKQGHCERYASALALMLRALGIPARIVKGYKGLEHQGEGHYVVRQNQIHAWVEALVPNRENPDERDWLTLDPTPDFGSSRTAPFSLERLWDDSQRGGQFFWNELIVGYNSDNQADLVQWLQARWRSPAFGAGLAVAGLVSAGGVAALLLRRRRRRRVNGATGPAVGFYGRLLELLAGHRGLTPATGQTPREFAGGAAAVLRGQEETAGWAELPAEVAELFYRVRFGARPLDGAESHALGQRLDGLAAVLRSAPRPAAS